MSALIAVPPPKAFPAIFPDAFLYGTLFLAILEITLGLMAAYPSFRRRAVLLILIGVVEIYLSLANYFIEGFFIGLATAICGTVVSLTYALKSQLRKNEVRIFLVLSGLFELGLAAVSPLILAIPLLVFGSYSLIVGIVGFSKAKPKQEVAAPKNRRKAIFVVAAAAVLVSAMLMYQYDVRTRPAYVNYSMGGSQCYPNESNAVSISCNNWGDRDANFYLTLSFGNASFSNQTEQPYIQVDSRAAKLPFSLKANSPAQSGSKTVFFTIDQNVTSFSCSLHLENNGLSPIAVGSAITHLVFRWNETAKCFDPAEGSGFIV